MAKKHNTTNHKQTWENWSVKQRSNFLKDHKLPQLNAVVDKYDELSNDVQLALMRGALPAKVYSKTKKGKTVVSEEGPSIEKYGKGGATKEAPEDYNIYDFLKGKNEDDFKKAIRSLDGVDSFSIEDESGGFAFAIRGHKDIEFYITPFWEGSMDVHVAVSGEKIDYIDRIITVKNTILPKNYKDFKSWYIDVLKRKILPILKKQKKFEKGGVTGADNNDVYYSEEFNAWYRLGTNNTLEVKTDYAGLRNLSEYKDIPWEVVNKRTAPAMTTKEINEIKKLITQKSVRKMSSGGNTEGKNGYVAFYKGKRTEVYADTSYEAQKKAAAFFKAKKTYEVTVVLAESDGEQVTHTPDFEKGGVVGESLVASEVSEDEYHEMRGAVPPIYIKSINGVPVSGAFAVGEPSKHIGGRPVHEAYLVSNGDKHYKANGYVWFKNKGEAIFIAIDKSQKNNIGLTDDEKELFSTMIASVDAKKMTQVGRDTLESLKRKILG